MHAPLPCTPPAMHAPHRACPPATHAPPWTDRHLWKHYLRKRRLRVIMITGANADRGLMDILHRHNRWWSHDEVTLPTVGVVVAYHHTNQGPLTSDPPFDYLVIIVIDCNPRIMSVLNWWHRYVSFIERLRVTRTTRSDWMTQQKNCNVICYRFSKENTQKMFSYILYFLIWDFFIFQYLSIFLLLAR